MRLLLNDTSGYHSGSAAAVDVIKARHKITNSLVFPTGSYKVPIVEFGENDLVILNGEGTLHGDAGRAVNYLKLLESAQSAGCETHIVNAVWQNMSHEFDHVLQKCRSITVREILSRDEIAGHGVEASICPDLSFFSDIPHKKYDYVEIYEGQYWQGFERYSRFSNINIFDQSWNEIVNRLRNSGLLITGRHHEMYAACKARCRFVYKASNTWKMEGLLRTAGVAIPFDIEGALLGKYDDQYRRLWHYLESYPCE